MCSVQWWKRAARRCEIASRPFSKISVMLMVRNTHTHTHTHTHPRMHANTHTHTYTYTHTYTHTHTHTGSGGTGTLMVVMLDAIIDSGNLNPKLNFRISPERKEMRTCAGPHSCPCGCGVDTCIEQRVCCLLVLDSVISVTLFSCVCTVH